MRPSTARPPTSFSLVRRARGLTGRLPFSAADPMEWVHCHIARKPVAPAERLESVPAPISEIVMKLLAKTAEERWAESTSLSR